MPTYHLLITGKVQGVFFRRTAKDEADKLGITGVVKNTGEGHVEIFFSGSDKDSDKFIEWCRNGPDRATVHHVEVESIEQRTFSGFSITR